MSAKRGFRYAAALVLTLQFGTEATAEPLPDDATLDQVLSAYYEAIGGLEGWLAVENMKTVSRVSSARGSGRNTVYRHRDGLYRRETEGPNGTSILLYDGETALGFPMGSSTPVPAPEGLVSSLRSSARIGGLLVAAADDGLALTFKGTERMRGGTYFVISTSPQDGVAVDYFIDQYTHLLEKVRTVTASGESMRELSDYREVDGLRLPFRVESDRQDARYESVEFNLDLPEDIFSER